MKLQLDIHRHNPGRRPDSGWDIDRTASRAGRVPLPARMRFLPFLLILLGLLMPAPAAEAAIPPAGSLIQSRSRVEYNIGPSFFQVFSPLVETRVSAVYGISLVPSGTVAEPAYTLVGTGGDTLYCSFSLANLGNTRDSLAVGYQLVPPSTATLENLILFHDQNGNDRLDGGEEDPVFLALDIGGATELSAAAVLPGGAGGGDSYPLIYALSTSDTVPVTQSTVIRVRNYNADSAPFSLGPHGNPKALPGGEGSANDLTRAVLDRRLNTFTFQNDLLNENSLPELIQLSLSDSTFLPDGLRVSIVDSTGQVFALTTAWTKAVLLGLIQAGEQRTIDVQVSSENEPIHSLISRPLNIEIVARSLIDTVLTNRTTDQLVPAQAINPAAVISLEQTFKENKAATGDVVSLVVTVRNISDSVRVDSLIITEGVQPALKFLESAGFETNGGSLSWAAGSLAGGEERRMAAKFVATSRVARGWAKVIGRAGGWAETGDPVSAGPAISALRIENDLFADEGVVLGDVFVDLNNNSRRDRGEPGVPGAAVYLESGAYALSDSVGKFSLPRSFAGYRIVRLDESSLPPGLRSTPMSTPLPSGLRPDPAAKSKRGAAPAPGAGTNSGTSFGDRMKEAGYRLVHLLPGAHAVVQFPVYKIPEPPPEVTTVPRHITCQEKVSIQKQHQVLYESLSIGSSLFASGKAYLSEGVIGDLEPVPAFLLSHPGWRILLEGHTDNVPVQDTRNFENNTVLSLERAKAVKRYLAANGVAEERIITRGYGETRPIADNSTSTGRSMNRRVEVSFIPAGVNEYDVASIDRVKAGMKAIEEIPDSVRIKIIWELVTDSPVPRDGELEFSIPERFSEAVVAVEKDGSAVQPVGGGYPVRSLRKSSGIHCEISCLAAAADTTLIRELTAVLELPAGAGEPGRGSADRVFHPYGGGPSTERAVVYDLDFWREEIPAVGPAGEEEPRTVSSESQPVGRVEVERPGEPPGQSLEDDADFGISSPGEGAVFTRSNQIRVCTRVPLGSRFELTSDGLAVPAGRIGEKEIHVDRKIERIAWYGVEIRPGRNTLRLNGRRIDGTEFEDSIQVVLASAPRRLKAERERVLIPADGRTTELIRFAVRDGQDCRVADGFVATVTEGDSLLSNPDARPDRRGLQLSSRDGYFVAQVRPDRRTGRKTLRLELDGLEASCEVAYVPPQRATFVSGLLDAKLGIFSSSGRGSPLGLSDYYDGAKLKGDSRLFLQGTGCGGLNLTARLDSRRQPEDPLLPGVEPEEDNGIYGDASELRFAAPARGGNYIALEKDESYLRYGDFRTPLDGGEFLRYQRAVTGLNAALTHRNDVFKAFLTRSDFATRRDELPGDGTSGYYYLSRSPLVEHSEKITLETRDRYQPEKVVDLRPLARNRDYTINYYDGAVLFKSPVPVTDDQFNPVYVVVIYEVRTAAEAGYVYGLRGDLAAGPAGRLGVTSVARSGDGQQYALYGVDGRLSVAGLTLAGEFARSDDEVSGDGNAFKLEAAYRNLLTENSIYYRQVDGGFLNPSFTGGAHELATRKYGYQSKLRIAPAVTLESEGFSQRLDRTEEKKEAVQGRVKVGLPEVELTAGLLGTRHHKLEDRRKGLLALAGLAAGRPEGPSFSLRLDKNLQRRSVDDYPDRLKSDLGIPFLERYQFLAGYEYRTASGQAGTHQGTGGVTSRLGQRGTVYTKYRLDRTASEERAGAVTGLKQQVAIRPNLSGSFDVENYHSLSEGKERDYFALKTGLGTVRPGSRVLEGQYEYRWEEARRKHLLRLNALAQLDGGVSVLLKNALAYTGRDDRPSELSYDARLAAAYRPEASPFMALGYVKTGYERFTPIDPEAVTWKLVLSLDLNLRPAAAHELRLKFAHKRIESDSYGLSVTSWSRLLLSQYVYQFQECWDTDVWARLVDQRTGGTREFGGGLEIGRTFYRFVRLSAGYSLSGFEDRDLAENDAWASGFDIRVQVVLSDWLFREMGM